MKKYGTDETEFIKKNKRGALRKIQSRKIVRKIDSPSDSCSFQDLKRVLVIYSLTTKINLAIPVSCINSRRHDSGGSKSIA